MHMHLAAAALEWALLAVNQDRHSAIQVLAIWFKKITAQYQDSVLYLISPVAFSTDCSLEVKGGDKLSFTSCHYQAFHQHFIYSETSNILKTFPLLIGSGVWPYVPSRISEYNWDWDIKWNISKYSTAILLVCYQAVVFPNIFRKIG